MLIRRIEDAEEIAAPFVAGLNACFNGWGDRRAFDWCFLRQVGAPPADLLVVERDGELIAGSAVTYRRMWRGGIEEPVACMTGSWTLPSARGQGIFRHMIDASLEAALDKGCGLLVGYGAAANFSNRPLVARSAAVIDAAFLTSPDLHEPVDERTAEPVDPAEATDLFMRRRFEPGIGRLLYRPNEWRGQMLERPWPSDAQRLADGTVVVLERRQGVDRLLDASISNAASFVAAVEAAAAISATEGRRLSTYSVEPEVIAGLAARGYSLTPACFYILLAGCARLSDQEWWFANGDRM